MLHGTGQRDAAAAAASGSPEATERPALECSLSDTNLFAIMLHGTGQGDAAAAAAGGASEAAEGPAR